MSSKSILQGSRDLHFAFDIGHSSIGWAVLKQSPNASKPSPEVLGCGTVTFGADDCLAIKRRQYRQQRRHIRATRQRIQRIRVLLESQGVFSEQELEVRHEQGKGDSFSWQKASKVLSAAREGLPIPALSKEELWEALRWYAHNRGYFSPPWANRFDDAEEGGDDVSDTEKQKRAHAKMEEFGTKTMAETMARYSEWYEEQAALWAQGKREDKPPHFKGLGAAFSRDSVVWQEVRDLLAALKGQFPFLTDDLVRTLMGNHPDPMKDPKAWETVPCPGLKLPKRFMGGLLFGQLIPRFNNRIIGVCPIHFANRQAELLEAGFSEVDAKNQAAKEAKLPSKATPEFLRFRWALQLANIHGACEGERDTRPLTPEERLHLTQLAEKYGAVGADKGKAGPKSFEKLVHDLTGWSRSNLGNMLMHPDAEKALVLDPAKRSIWAHSLSEVLTELPERFQKRLVGKLRAGKSISMREVRSWLEGDDAQAFDARLGGILEKGQTKRRKKEASKTREDLLAETVHAERLKGRAPYARPVMAKAYEEVMKGWDPRAEASKVQPRGCLCRTQELTEAQLKRSIAEQTNNHLIRHRLMILERLLNELIESEEFANGDRLRVGSLTIEVAREVKDLSGKTRKEQEQDLGIRLKSFKDVAAQVEEACRRRGMPTTAGLIRKARVAEDLGWTCPYTGKEFDIDQILDGKMDREHIIPHSDRQSDSLDSLVITWAEVNKWKGKRTALEFIRDEGGKVVPGRNELTIMTLKEFETHVGSLERRKGHADDIRRKKRRIERLLTEVYEEKEFTPRDLTVTSHLVRLGGQVLQRNFEADSRPPVVSLPGSVTGAVRKAWKLIGCLSAANPSILEEDGKTPRQKQEIRGITHLHHALDACVLGLTAMYFPRNGRVWSAMASNENRVASSDDPSLWSAMVRRRPSSPEASLLQSTGLYRMDSSGRMHLSDLPAEIKAQIRTRLAEKRVVQHIPAEMGGIKIEENTRGVVGIREDGRVELRQKSPRNPKTGLRPPPKPTDEVADKLLGLHPVGTQGKLKRQSGVRIISENYGIAILDKAADGASRFVPVRWYRVWHQLQALKAQNAGRMPRVLRNGMLVRLVNTKPTGARNGVWRVRSAKASLKLDLSWADSVQMKSKGDGFWREVSLASLGAENIEIMPSNLTGEPQR